MNSAINNNLILINRDPTKRVGCYYTTIQLLVGFLLSKIKTININ